MRIFMEWIIPFLLTFLLMSALAQLIWGYALSAIAEKGGQSDLMQVLAWVPLLQMAPLIVAGGGSVGGFFLGAIGLVLGALVLGFASAFVGGAVGSALGGLGLICAGFVSLFYFGRIMWNTATDRGLPGWIGLLIFVPLANFLVYPYIAFHDGLSAPNKIGLILGLVLTIGSTAPSFQAVQRVSQLCGLPPDFAALMSGDADMRDLGFLETLAGAATESEAVRKDGGRARSADVESIKALYSMQDRFEQLRRLVESNELQKPEQQRAAMDLIRAIDLELARHRPVLDEETYHELATDLMRSEARVLTLSDDSAPRNTLEFANSKAPAREPASYSSPGPASFHSQTDPNPAPMRPIPVQAADDCPDDTTLQTRAREDGDEEWCQQLDGRGGLRHGWYARYAVSGQPESMGEYANGLRVGVWTRFYPSGRVRAQAEFVAGLQHGWLLSFNESGERTKAVRFDQGVAVP